MAHFSTLLTLTTVALLTNLSVCRNLRHGRPGISHPLPRDDIPFDGQYIDVNAQNGATEWWWFQVNGAPDPTTGVIPGLHVTFYEGYPLDELRALAGGDNAAQNYIVLDIALPNNMTYSEILPAPSATITPFQGTSVQGIWNPPGLFSNFGSSVNLQVSVPSTLTAQVTINSDGRGQRFGCPNGPYFGSALPAGASLTANEQVFFEQVGWAISQTGGSATVQLTLSDQPAVFFQGQGYHDANWMPTTLNSIVDDWYFMNAQIGPFDLTAVRSRVKDSSRIFNQGYLQDTSGQPLQYQCSIEGSRSTDVVSVTPFGLGHDSQGMNVMAGFTLDYKLANGDEYRFTLTGQRFILDTPFYHRWVGTASGGKVGGQQFSGVAMFDWLNPSNTAYNG